MVIVIKYCRKVEFEIGRNLFSYEYIECEVFVNYLGREFKEIVVYIGEKRRF